MVLVRKAKERPLSSVMSLLHGVLPECDGRREAVMSIRWGRQADLGLKDHRHRLLSSVVRKDFVSICHRRDCQKFTGSAFGTLRGLPQSALEIQGELKSFSKLGDSGKAIMRLFCPERGSRRAHRASFTHQPSPTRPPLLLSERRRSRNKQRPLYRR